MGPGERERDLEKLGLSGGNSDDVPCFWKAGMCTPVGTQFL